MIIENPSPNYSTRRNSSIDCVVLHYTAGASATSSIRWLCNPDAQASAHYVISRKGQIYQLVDVKNKAFHAGRSELEINGIVRRDVNDFSIGIELANLGLLQEIEDRFYYEVGRTLVEYTSEPPTFATLRFSNGNEVEGFWESYAAEQLNALKLLLSTIGDRFPRAVENLVAHEEIGIPIGRKLDVGPLFPWDIFTERKIVRKTSGRLSAAGADCLVY